MTQPDIAILGGGVIGLTTAYYLAKSGASVAVVERGAFGQEASWAGAGIIPPSVPACARTPFDRLRALSVGMLPELAAELRDATGIDNGYRRCGGLEFVRGSHEADSEEWHGEGVRCQLVEPSDLPKVAPDLATTQGPAWYLPDLAQLRNPRHLRALLEACREKVRLLPHQEVLGLGTRGGRVESINTAAGPIAAGQVVVAAGAWSADVLRPLGVVVPVSPVRGQIALLWAPDLALSQVVMWGSCYLVPRGDGNLLVGSTEEHVGFDKSTTEEAIAGLRALAVRLAPGLASTRLQQAWAGLRPGSPDGLPYLGPVPQWDNLWIAAGHYRAGIQLSAGTARVLCDVLQGRQPPLDLTPFRLDRPAVQ